MKRTAAALMLIAGLSGGCMTTNKKPEPKVNGPEAGAVQATGYVGPHGEPITRSAYRGQSPAVTRADYIDNMPGKVVPASGAELIPEKTQRTARGGWVPTGSDGVPGYYPGRGVLPVPAMGPYGAVAAVGALPPQGLLAPI